MSGLRLKDALDLLNARMRDKNPDHKEIKHPEFGRYVLEGGKTQENISMTALKYIRGERKTFPFEYMNKACEFLGVDSNFLYGQKSKHDADFDRLVRARRI